MNFILKNGNSIIKNKKVDIQKVNNYVTFNDEEYKITFLANDTHFYFKRESDDDLFVISYVNNNIESYIKLKKDNYKLDLNMLKYEYNYSDDKIKFKYIIESDEKKFKTIEIIY